MGTDLCKRNTMSTQQQGSAMLELILGTVLVSASLVALWHWQNRNLEQQAQAMQQLVARTWMQRMTQQLRGLANGESLSFTRTAPPAWDWTAQVMQTIDCRTRVCEPDTWRQSVLAALQTDLQQTLPGGQSRLAWSSATEGTLEVRWKNQQPAAVSAEGLTCPINMTCLSQQLSW